MPTELLEQDRTARRPAAYFTGRNVWRKRLARAVARVNRLLHRFPPCRWAYRWQLFRQLEISRMELSVGSAHVGLHGVRLAFLSDLHVGSYLTGDDVSEVFRRVSELQPDVVLLGGDLVHTRPDEVHEYEGALRHLRAPMGTFAVPGNHEYFFDLDIGAWERALESSGVEILTNRGVRLGRRNSSFWLAGVDDLTEGRPDLPRALSGRRDGEPAVLVSHHPDLFAEAARHGVELTLSGHTHGGQVSPFGWIPLRHSELGFHRGEHVDGSCRLKVGRGVGASILPLRIGARPEVVVVDFRTGPP